MRWMRERREEEIDFEDWEEKWLFWERDWVCYLWNENEHMDGCCWGDGLMMICMIDMSDLSACVCVFIHNERERFISGLNEELLKMIINWNW